jgi:hypothetical protein
MTSISAAVGMGVGVSSVAGVTSQSSVSNGSAPSLPSVCFYLICTYCIYSLEWIEAHCHHPCASN